MNWRVAVTGVAIIIPLLVVLAMGFGQDPHAVPSVLEGKPLPHFKLMSLDGNEFTEHTLVGKPAVINFWATWCAPCKLEHELLQEAAQYYASKVQFIGVVYEDTGEAARSYLRSRSNHYPQLLDDGSQTAIDFGVSGVPESFIVGPDGIILHKEAGVLSAQVLRRYLDPYAGK